MNETTAASSEIEFWFEFGSTYSYLSVMRIEEAARRHGVDIAWRPFLLGPIFRELGFEGSPFTQQKEKGAYMQRDMARQCRKLGLAPWQTPSVFPRACVLPLRILWTGRDEAWIGAFCRKVMERNFVLDQDINSVEAMTDVLDQLGLPAAELVRDAQSEPVKAALRAQTEEARRRGIFGAPTFFAGKEMFWGNDRLDDALAWAASDIER